MFLWENFCKKWGPSAPFSVKIAGKVTGDLKTVKLTHGNNLYKRTSGSDFYEKLYDKPRPFYLLPTLLQYMPYRMGE